MEFSPFIRVPFTISACQITEENLEAAAELLGEVQTEGDVRFIALSRKRGPNTRVYIGWWVTRFNDNVHCYPPKTFTEQFVQMPADGRYVWIHDEAEEKLEDVVVSNDEVAETPPVDISDQNA